MVTRKRVKKTGFALLSAGALVFILAEAAIVCDGLTDYTGRADVALVLGSKVNEDGTVSRRLRGRLDRALELAISERVDSVVVSGGLGREGHLEADVMRAYLMAHGVPAERIIVDNEGTTTWASAENLHRISERHDFDSVIVVSQFFHISRAKIALRKAGMKNIGGVHSTLFEWRDIYAAAREFPAICKYLAYCVL